MLQELLQLLESNRPDLYASIDPDNVTEEQVRALLSEAMQPATAADAGATDGETTSASMVPSTPAEDTAPVLKQAHQIVESLQLTQCGLWLSEALAAAQLPPPVSAKLRTQFQSKIFEQVALHEAIAAERTMLAALSESGKVVGFGGADHAAHVTGDEDDKRLGRLLDFFEGKVHSFRECYTTLTDDGRVQRFPHAPIRVANWQRLAEAHGITLRESIDSTTFAQVLADVMHKRMVAEYRRPDLNLWRRLVLIGTFSDFKTQHRTRIGGYGNLPTVLEQAPYATRHPHDVTV